MGEVTRAALDRREVVARLLADRKDLLVVTGLGSASYDVWRPATTTTITISGRPWAAPPWSGLASRRRSPTIPCWS